MPSKTEPEPVFWDFVLRRIPDDIHRSWKSIAALQNITMQRYALIALKRLIQQDLNKIYNEQKNN